MRLRIINWARVHLARPTAIYWITLVALVLMAPSIWGGFAADDHFLRMVIQGFPGMEELAAHPVDTFVFADGTLERNLLFKERGLMPWWAVPDVRLAFWRPLASITHYLDVKVFGDWAGPMHVQNLGGYALLALGVMAVYRRFIPTPWIAGLAALLYVWDDAHGMPVGWIANRNGIMAGVCVCLVLLHHDAWRRLGKPLGAPFAFVSFAAGLLCGEATIAVCGYLFAHALFMDRRGWLRGLVSIVPYGVIVLLWRYLYNAMGYGSTGSAMYLDPGREPGLYLRELLQRFPVLLNAQFGYPPSTMSVWTTGVAKALLVVWALAFLLYCAWMLRPVWRANPAAKMFALGMVLAILPACATFPMDRLLFYSGIGAAGLIAMFLGGLADAAEWRPADPLWNKAAGLLALFFVAVHIVLSPLSLPVRCMTMTFTGLTLERAAQTLPKDPGIANKDLILVATATDFDGWHVPIMRSSMRKPVPRHTWVLSVGPNKTRCKRIDERSLLLTIEKGFVPYPWGRMFRGFSYPFRVGGGAKLSGLTIEILSLTEDGSPREVSFRFDKPLEDSAYVFVALQRGRYEPFVVPALGQEVEIEPPLMFGFDKYRPAKSAEDSS